MSALEEALRSLLARRRAPLTTYRLQLHRGFDFRAAAAVLPYLSDLGVTDAYTSPILQARPGSLHGYDITDHGRLNPELGGDEGYELFASSLRERGMGHLLDFVPNHMGLDPETNAWWRDVLEHGPSSPYAGFFDIDWTPAKWELRNKVLLPVLGDQYGAVLERGELRVGFEDGRFFIFWPAGRLPLDPQQWPRVLRRALPALEDDLRGDARLPELLSVVKELESLPPRGVRDPAKAAERRREAEVARGRLDGLVRSCPPVARRVAEAVASLNGTPGEPRSFDDLHELLEAQAYRLSYWKTAAHEINYRRFFDVNDLGGLCIEEDAVFDAAHRRVLRLLAEDKVLGLRVDHPDGLYDPGRYFERLQSSFARAWLARRLHPGAELSAEEERALEDWRAEQVKRDFRGPGARPLYVVGEKILTGAEEVDPHWAVDGTSGYDFLNDAVRLFLEPRRAAEMRAIYGDFTGKRAPLETVIYACKKLIMSTSLSSELNVLADRLNRVSEQDRRSRDFTLQSLRDALREIVACFPVYRTYMTEALASARDREVIDRAVAGARRRNPAAEPSIFDFVRSILLSRGRTAMKIQQYTGPVHAKGLEDTAFYRYNALLALNEVGSDPARSAVTPRELHDANARRARDAPRSLLATATHDVKRGEDARMRLAVLAQVPDEWRQAAVRWSRANAGAKSVVEGAPAPDANDEYLYYQALLGAWDFAREDEEGTTALSRRLQDYLLKAAREAKLRTSWVAPDDAYEKALSAFVVKTLADRAFLRTFLPFARRAAALGAAQSLAQLALKCVTPGVADFYQGAELWDLSFVDPDNRRPVDFDLRRRLLREVDARTPGTAAAELLASWPDGRVKLYVTARLLRLRRERAALFAEGAYVPLEVEGDPEERFFAFARELGGERVVAVVPRLIAAPLWREGPAGLPALARGARLRRPEGWAGEFVDVLSGASLPPDGALSPVFEALPVCVLAGPRTP